MNDGLKGFPRARASSGGSGTPGGSDTHVQFNDGGVFGGVSDFLWDKTLKVLTLVAGKIKSVTEFLDANGNELLKFTTTASAVNEVTITNATTGNPAKLSSSGGDADANLQINTQGDASILGLQDNNITINRTGQIKTVAGVATRGTFGVAVTGEPSGAEEKTSDISDTDISNTNAVGFYLVMVYVVITAVDGGMLDVHLKWNDGHMARDEVVINDLDGSIDAFGNASYVIYNGDGNPIQYNVVTDTFTSTYNIHVQAIRIN